MKRCRGLTAYIKIENPPGTHLQKLFVREEELKLDKVYTAAYLTEQGIPAEFGRNRKTLSQDAHTSMLAYLAKHKPAHAELAGTVIAN